ncbi:MAG: hypothetical protein CXR31_15725 [Geobacter sp.]|nr:MAG: hypothetical protein CXR31_15725 [Geobacter sp.]
MRTKILIGCAIILAIYTSGVIGYRLGRVRTMGALFQLEIGTEMASLSTDLKVAELLKTNQKEKAEELLENLIDVRVSSLGIQAANREFEPIRGKIIDSIHKAKNYRQQYTSPTHKINENQKSGVEAAFRL